jgi:hypothetical protein
LIGNKTDDMLAGASMFTGLHVEEGKRENA